MNIFNLFNQSLGRKSTKSTGQNDLFAFATRMVNEVPESVRSCESHRILNLKYFSSILVSVIRVCQSFRAENVQNANNSDKTSARCLRKT